MVGTLVQRDEVSIHIPNSLLKLLGYPNQVSVYVGDSRDKITICPANDTIRSLRLYDTQTLKRQRLKLNDDILKKCNMRARDQVSLNFYKCKNSIRTIEITKM